MMKYRKLKSLGMALLILASTAADFVMPVAAANASDSQQAATLGFVKEGWDTDKDPERTSMVSGSKVDVKIDVKSGFDVSPESNFNYDLSTGEKPDEGDIVIEGGGTTGVRGLTVSKDYPVDGTKQTVQVTGNYYTTKGVGWAQEVIDGSPQVEIDALVDPARIMQFGRIKLECTQGENVVNGKAAGGAKFKITEATDGLSKYDPSKYDPAKPPVIAASRADNKLKIEMNVDNPSGSTGGTTVGGDNKLTFTIAPSKAYEYFKDPTIANQYVDQNGTKYVPYDANNPPPAGSPMLGSDGKPPMKTINDVIQKGETITLILRKPVSNTLSLTIYSPKAAVDEISSQILSDATNASPKKFVQLAGADELTWITNDFKLRQRYNEFNTEFKIEWGWLPDDTTGTDKDAIHVASTNSEWTDVVVNRNSKNDIKGKLTYKVHYSGLQGATGLAEGSVPVIVKGTGISPVMKMTGKWLHTQEGPCADEIVDYKDIFDTDGATLGENPDRKQYKMDVFKGGIPGYKNSETPYRHKMNIEMGAVQSYVHYMIIDVIGGNADAVNLALSGPNGVMEIYKPGTQYKNPSQVQDVPTNVTLQVDAVKKGEVKLRFRFFVAAAKGVVELVTYRPEVTFTVEDRSPSDDSSLKSLILKDHNGKVIEFGFSPDKLEYKGVTDTIHLPFQTDNFTITPQVNDPAAKKQVHFKTMDINENPKELITGKPTFDVESSRSSPKMEIKKDETNEVRIIKLTVTAQNPNKTTDYFLHVMRDPPSVDANLKSLSLATEEKPTENLVKGFDPLNAGPYQIRVPYRTKWLKVAAEPSSPYAREVIFTPTLEDKGIFFGSKDWLDIRNPNMPDGPNGSGIFTVGVLPEDTNITAPREYKVEIYREPPGDVSTLKALSMADANDKPLTYTPAFKTTTEKFDQTQTFQANIAYSTKQIKLNVSPTDPYVDNIQIYDMVNKAADGVSDKLLFDLKSGSLKPDVFTKAFDVLAITDDKLVDTGFHNFKIVVTAEDTSREKSEYELRVVRDLPSDEARLKSLFIKDQAGAQIKTFSFHQDETAYNLEVPYETDAISFTPTALDPNGKIRIYEGSEPSTLDKLNPYYIASGGTTKNFKLGKEGEEKTFTVVCYAEDFDPTPSGVLNTDGDPDGKTKMEYRITLKRGMPSDDARLKGLTAGGIVDKLKPVFISSTLKYTATVAEGAAGVTITATANHPAATIKINGEVVESGKAYGPIELIEVDQTIDIVVTAQDGTTQKTYQIAFHNENLIDKTSNADLRKLTINYGQMTPNFKAAVTEYEVAVVEDAYSVDIIPRADDSLAEVQVFAGTKEIGDYNGNYAQALEDGENEITIKVVSPDKKVTKEYAVVIYRNEEDELKNLTPLTEEDIDFEMSDDVIIVSINQYPRVTAGVFNKLKEYPEKTIIFQGNDYSLTFKAADIKRIIPQTEIYDFRMSYTSPQEEEIYDLIDSRNANDDIINRAVMLYFDYHGDLPAPATMNLSLGRKYANQTLYWHYYNMERERIDYYGNADTNTKGTFAVYIDHFSTYIVTPRHRISGSEDKQGNIAGDLDDLVGGENLTPESKVNPNTGERGVAR